MSVRPPLQHTQKHTATEAAHSERCAAAGVRPALCTCCVVIRFVKLAAARRGGRKHARTTDGGGRLEKGAKEGGYWSGGDVIDC